MALEHVPQLKGKLTNSSEALKQSKVCEADYQPLLVGGFNLCEKYESEWEASPSSSEKKIFETTTVTTT